MNDTLARLPVKAQVGEYSALMSWEQIVHWAAEHAAVVSLGGVFTVIASAYTGHLLTKSRENMKRLRDHDTASRKVMLDKCLDLLAMTVEVKAWVRSSRAELGRLAAREDKSQAIVFLHKIEPQLYAFAVKMESLGTVAMDFCPTEFMVYPKELVENVVQFLPFALENWPEEELSAAEAEARVDASVKKLHGLIRSTYNVEMYDNLDPRKLRKRIKYGFTEKSRREYRKQVTAQIVSMVEKTRDEPSSIPQIETLELTGSSPGAIRGDRQ